MEHEKSVRRRNIRAEAAAAKKKKIDEDFSQKLQFNRKRASKKSLKQRK